MEGVLPGDSGLQSEAGEPLPGGDRRGTSGSLSVQSSQEPGSQGL